MALILLKSQAISQTSDSVTCIPNTQLRKAINLIERGKVVEEELQLTKENVSYLQKRIDKKDSIIYKYGMKEIMWKRVDSNYKTQIYNLNKVVSNSQKIYETREKQLSREKKKKWLFLIAGIASSYFIINK